MRNIFHIAVVSAVVILVALAGEAVAEKPIWSKPPLVVVHSNNTPPLSFSGHNGQAKGFVYDFWQEWSATTGIPITFVQTDWPGTLQMMRDGTADIHGGLYFTEERDKFLDYSPPYFNQKGTLFVRKGLMIDDISQVGDRCVAVLDQGFSEHWMRNNHPTILLKPYKTAHQMVEAAVNGEVDALLTEYTTLVYQLGAKAQSKSFLPLATLYERSLRGAVAEGNAGLLSIVVQGLEAMDEEDREKVFSRWIIKGRGMPEWLLPGAVGGVFVMIVILLGMLVGGRRQSR